jgi:hypothetical protein
VKAAKKYMSLGGQGNLTLHELIEKQIWQKPKCDLAYKENNNIEIGQP